MRDINFQSVFATPAQKQCTMRSLAVTPDGRIWRYLQATEIITKHYIVETPATLGEDTVSSASQGGKRVLIQTGGADSTWTAGAYIDHWVFVDDGTGEGQVGKIKDNSATELTLYDDYALATALAVADSDITIVHAPDAENLDASSSNAPIQGVAQVAFAANDYGWFLVKGIGGVIIGDTAAEANELVVVGSDAAGGGVGIGNDADREDESIVGKCIIINPAADKAALVDVNILAGL